MKCIINSSKTLDLGNAGGGASPSPTHQPDPDPLSQLPQCLRSSGTRPQDYRHGHTHRSVPGRSTMYFSGEKTISPSLFPYLQLSVRAPLPIYFFSITLFCFIFIYNMLVQTLHFVKAYRRPPCPPPRKKTGGASSPFSGGKNRGVGF